MTKEEIIKFLEDQGFIIYYPGFRTKLQYPGTDISASVGPRTINFFRRPKDGVAPPSMTNFKIKETNKMKDYVLNKLQVKLR